MKNVLTKEEKEIIEHLKKGLWCEVPDISQERFDNLVDYIYNNIDYYNEMLWRLCGCYDKKRINFNKVMDIYIDNRNEGYLAELICYVNESIDYQHLVDKIIEINDKEFYYCFSRNNWPMLDGLIDYYYEKQMEYFYNKE